jgi:hypothetical protein
MYDGTYLVTIKLQWCDCMQLTPPSVHLRTAGVLLCMALHSTIADSRLFFVLPPCFVLFHSIHPCGGLQRGADE